MLWMVAVYHDRDKTADSLMKVLDAEIESLRTTPVDSATLERARTKMRSSLYSIVEEFSGLGKLDLLAAFALFDNDPAKINTLEDGFAAVTPDQIMKTANEWLRTDEPHHVHRVTRRDRSNGGGWHAMKPDNICSRGAAEFAETQHE